MSDLETATLDEILLELKARYKTVVVLTLREPKKNTDASVFDYFYRGGLYPSLGMAQRFIVEATSGKLDTAVEDENT